LTKKISCFKRVCLSKILRNTAIKIITNIRSMQARCENLRTKGKKIVLVPTMGYLHEGHLSLIREGRKRGDYLVVSIFINPIQFGPREDLMSYPRDLRRDVELMKPEHVDAVFHPDIQEMYGPRFETSVRISRLTKPLCGRSLPIRFAGVATIVIKLFNIIKPHVALFGMKDFQQFAVIRQMADDLNCDVEIVGMPTVRDKDGLALSTQNIHLTAEQRPAALSLSKALEEARTQVLAGEVETGGIVRVVMQIVSAYPETVIDYIEVCDPETLVAVEHITKPALLAVAVKIGKTRLIDNMMLYPAGIKQNLPA